MGIARGLVKNWWLGPRFGIREATFWLLIANAVLLGAIIANPSTETLGNWSSKAQEILSGSIPESNFYPIGSAVAVVPFEAVGVPVVFAHLVYANVGFIGFFYLSRIFLHGPYLRIFILLGVLNGYLFWLLAGTQDTVLEFAGLPWAIYFLVSKRPVLFGIIATLLVAVRPGNLLWIGLAVLIMLFRERKAAWLAPLLLLVGFAGFNGVAYGSPSPSLNGSMGFYQGQKLGHYLTLPLYDFDVVVGRDRPAGLAGAENQAAASGIWLRAGIQEIMDDPSRFVSASVNKTFDYFFHVSKNPRFSFPAYFSEEDSTLTIEYSSPSPIRVVVESVYGVTRVVILALSLFSLVGFALVRPIRTALYRKANFLLLPLMGGYVSAMALTVDTRFTINYEVLLAIWALSGACFLKDRIQLSRQEEIAAR